MTIAYSKNFTEIEIGLIDWRVEGVDLFCLLEPSESSEPRGLANIESHTTTATNDFPNEAHNTAEGIENQLSMTTLSNNVTDTTNRSRATNSQIRNTKFPSVIDTLWIYYNHDTIAALVFGTQHSRNLLEYASKLPSLGTIHIYRVSEFDDTHFEAIVNFIEINQSTFPMKRPLSHLISSLALATSKPSRDRLTEFRDHAPFRVEMGQGEAMKSFLQRCHNLRTLALTIYHLEVLSWITQEQQTVSSKYPPMNLRELELSRTSVHQSSVIALNAAFTAFPSSLEKVSLGLTTGAKDSNFPFLLPNLTELKLTAPSINIGSLDKCPNLEILFISTSRFAQPKEVNELNISQHEGHHLYPTQGLIMYTGATPTTATKINYGEFLVQQHKLRSPTVSTTEDPNQQFGIFGSSNNQKWSMPFLTNITIDGATAEIFSLEYL
ncbi:hypothetical protein BGZ76_008192 [Entomortierella beljakovae]|nr:hypothetical protein BGZ76_008192 [Entomortierella beljakovae]